MLARRTPASLASGLLSVLNRMTIWPGRAYPLGATYDGRGTNFSVFSEVAERVELCLFDDDGPRDARHASRSRRLLLARLRARASVPASATASACTGRGRPRKGIAAIPRSCCSIRTRRRSTAQVHWNEAVFGLSLRRSREQPQRRRQRALRAEGRRRRPVLRLGRRRAARARRCTSRSSTRCTSRASRARHPEIPPELRGTYAGLAHPAAIELSAASSASPRSSCCRSTSSCTTRTWSSAACATTGATTRSAFFAPHDEYSSSGPGAASRSRVQDDGARRCTAPASR